MSISIQVNGQDVQAEVDAWRAEQMQKIHNMVNSAAWWRQNDVMAEQLLVLNVQEAAYRQGLTAQQAVGDTTQADTQGTTADVPATPSADKTGSAETGEEMGEGEVKGDAQDASKESVDEPAQDQQQQEQTSDKPSAEG